MTTTHTSGAADLPDALRLADWLQNAVATYPQMSEDEPGGYCQEVDQVMDQAAAELRRLHNESVESHAGYRTEQYWLGWNAALAAGQAVALAVDDKTAGHAMLWRQHCDKLDALVTYCPTCCQGFIAQKEMTRDQIIYECGKTAGRATRPAPPAMDGGEDAARLDWIAVHGSFGVDSATGEVGGNGQKRLAATRKNIDAAIRAQKEQS